MEKEIELVMKSIDGDTRSFKKLILSYTPLLESYLQRKGIGASDVHDILQESFLKAFQSIKNLEKPSAFSSWLYSIVRSFISRYWRTYKNLLEFDESLGIHEAEENEILDNRQILSNAIQSLQTEQAALINLHYFSALSYKEIALVLKIDEKLVKSRLYEARKNLKSFVSEKDFVEIEEEDAMINKVMNQIEKEELGAYIIERLSLADQMEFCENVCAGEALNEELLRGIGKIDRGAEFVTVFHKQIVFKELISFLNRVDHYVEKRLILALEKKNSEVAERIKENMFVFEDFVLLSEDALRLFVKKVDREQLAHASTFTMKMVVDHFLKVMSASEKEKFLHEIQQSEITEKESQWYQRKMVEQAYLMDQAGFLKNYRDEKTKQVVLDLSEKGKIELDNLD